MRAGKNLPSRVIRWVVVSVCIGALVWAVNRSKSETEEMKSGDEELGAAAKMVGVGEVTD